VAQDASRNSRSTEPWRDVVSLLSGDN